MPGKTRRSKKNKRTKKRTKKRRYGGAPALSSKIASAKLSEKKEKIMELIKEKYKRGEENIGLTNSTIDIYEYVSEHPNILKDKKIQNWLIVLLEQDTDDVEEQINANEEQLSNDYVNARMRLERFIEAAKRNA